jgi:hypothetical protein
LCAGFLIATVRSEVRGYKYWELEHQWEHRFTNVYKNKEFGFEFVYVGTYLLDPDEIRNNRFVVVPASHEGKLIWQEGQGGEYLEVMKSTYKDFSEMRDKLLIEYQDKDTKELRLFGEPALITEDDGCTFTFILKNGFVYKFCGINQRSLGWMTPRLLETTFRFTYTEKPQHNAFLWSVF